MSFLMDTPVEQIISHVRSSDLAIQSNADHCLGVAKLASAFTSEYGMSDFGSALGLLHDKGKERKSFQKYIRSLLSGEILP